jgi:hypothetical protein
MKRNCKLINVDLIKEGECYYLTPTYRIEDDIQIVEETLHKIPLPLTNISIITSEHDDSGHHVDIGYGPIYIPSNRVDTFASVKVIEEKFQELTVEEIEKRLGYKVKIVDNQKTKEIPVKCAETCRRCRFHVKAECGYGCKGCPNFARDNGPGKRCLCGTVKHNEPCPYFEEWGGKK